jgi:hypothetical protein
MQINGVTFFFSTLTLPFHRSLFLQDFSVAALIRSVMPLELYSLYMAKDILYRSSVSACLSTRWQIEMDCGDLQRSTNVTGNQDRLQARRKGEEGGGTRWRLHIQLLHSLPLTFTRETIPYTVVCKPMGRNPTGSSSLI